MRQGAPLEDLRIVAVEQYGAGPWATLQLADLGADVVKVEDPSVGGDVARYVPPFQEGELVAVLRDVQPRQAQRSASTCATPTGAPVRGARRLGRRGVLEPARGRPGEAAPDLRRPAGGQSADRLLLAVGVRHDRPAHRRGRLRLHHPGTRRLAERDRRAGRAADASGAVARRLHRRLRGGDRDAGRRLASAARRRRLRRRGVAVRDRARPAHVPRHLGGLARLRAGAARAVRPPVAGAVRELPDRRRLDGRSRARSRTCGGRCARPSAGRSWRRMRATTPSPRALAAPRRAASPSSTRGSLAHDREWVAALTPHACRVPRSTTSRARSPTSRRWPARCWQRSSTASSERSARSARRSGSAAGTRRRAGPRSGRAWWRGGRSGVVRSGSAGWAA